MNRLSLRSLLVLMVALAATFALSPAPTASAQPDTPVEQWTGKTVLLIGAHPDDDSDSHGTLALLRANDNEVYVMLLTLGNVGTKDPDLSRIALAKVRRTEELDALSELGIPKDHYINLGYDDGRLEYADREEIIERMVHVIRQLRPNVVLAFDPGQDGAQRWHKADHRSAAYLAADAARAAEWPLLYPGHLVNEGLQAYQIEEYLFYDTGRPNTWVDISDHVDDKIDAEARYVSQWGPHGQDKYDGPTLSAEQESSVKERLRSGLEMHDGKPVEAFRYYKGIPDGIGR